MSRSRLDLHLHSTASDGTSPPEEVVRLAAEAGMNLALLSLRDPDETVRLVPDGRPNEFLYQGSVVEVMVTDERGKLDINAADEQTLFTLLTGHGLELDAAQLLAAAIEDWRDTDDVERANGAELDTYVAAGLGVGPGNRPFIMTEELLQVLGMPWELYKKIEPGLTVYSNAGQPDPAYAPVEALLALPDMTEQDAVNFVADRHSEDLMGGVGAVLPNGQVAMARGRGVTYSIVAKATLPNGIWDQVDATVRLGAGSDGRPYRVLRWREGFHN